MTALPEPQWPIIALALVQLVDGIMCFKPVPYIVGCLEGVKLPRRYWCLLSPVKFAATAGLIAALWIPYLGAVTCAALVVYFVCAIAAHIIARDFSSKLFVNATGMLLICVATGLYCFVL